MPEPFPKPENLYDVDYGIPDGAVPPCMREGLENIVRNNDNWPSMAIGTFIAELHGPATDEQNSTVQKVTLHCAAKALGRCAAQLNTYAPDDGIHIPKRGVFDAGQLERLDCPRKSRKNA